MAVIDNYRSAQGEIRTPGNDYWTVEMGPVPGKPAWHQEAYAHQAYAFPTLDAATRFAQAHKDPGRRVAIRYPDGRVWDGRGFVAA